MTGLLENLANNFIKEKTWGHTSKDLASDAISFALKSIPTRHAMPAIKVANTAYLNKEIFLFRHTLTNMDVNNNQADPHMFIGLAVT